MAKTLVAHSNLILVFRQTIGVGVPTPVEVSVRNGPLYVYQSVESHHIGTSWTGPVLVMGLTPSEAFEPIVSINGVVLAVNVDYTRVGDTLDLTPYISRSGYVKTDGDLLTVFFFPASGPGAFQAGSVCVRVSARYTVADEHPDGTTLGLPYRSDPSRRSRVFLNGVRLTPTVDYKLEESSVRLFIPVGGGGTPDRVDVEFGVNETDMGVAPEDPGDWASFAAVPDPLLNLTTISGITAGDLSSGDDIVLRCGPVTLTANEVSQLKALLG